MGILGGYKVINFKGTSLSSTEAVIPGIYEAIEGTKKALLLEGLVLGGVEKRATWAEAEVSDGDYLINAYGYTITITDDDEVTAEEITE